MLTIYVLVYWQDNVNALTGLEVNTAVFFDIVTAIRTQDENKSYGYHTRIDTYDFGQK